MTTTELRARADQRFQAAISAAGARDPREFYRERLKELKQRDAEGFRRAVAYFEERLIPAVAANGSDPIAEWLEYGRFLAGLVAPGRTVTIDATGRASDAEPPLAADLLVLHLPSSVREPALVVGLPPMLSPAQRATFDLLVAGRRG